MSIFFTSDGISSVSQLGNTTESSGIIGFSYLDTGTKLTPDIISVRDQMNKVIERLFRNSSFQETNYVGSGKQNIVGTSIDGGIIPPLEGESQRQIYSQTPQVSVIIKKRAFSSLKHLYNPIYMDPAEKWLFRAIKRLVQRKCAIMSEYERLTKIESFIENGLNPATILAGLMIDEEEQKRTEDSTFDSLSIMEQTIRARQPCKTTTYFINPKIPSSNIGVGHGTFEVTTVSQINTSLDLSGNGSCTFQLEDPLNILFINEEDIEISIRETAESTLMPIFQMDLLNQLMDSSQRADSELYLSRKRRGVSQISFTIDFLGNDVFATVDSTGFIINENNIKDLPQDQSFTSEEQRLFGVILTNLKTYEETVRQNSLRGNSNLNADREKSENMNYVRRNMRVAYLGKYLIQPMDSINIFISGGTRLYGEGESVTNGDILETHMSRKKPSSSLNKQGISGLVAQDIDDRLIEQEYKYFIENQKNAISFQDFKRLRTLQLSTEIGTHVFGGLIKDVSESFDASSGKTTISINAGSNIEWLKISRFNNQPSLDQTQGMVHDPLTPFSFKTDPTTGLPTGKPELLQANKNLLNGSGCRRIISDTGPERGKTISTQEDLANDISVIGGSIITLFDHVPGLMYRWKEGIMTATYNMYSRNPKDNTIVDPKQFRRDMGFFWSNTAFDNLDAANILSILITGFPYNASTFVQGSGASFIPNTSINTARDFFHTFFDIHRTDILTHGNFLPFKKIEIDRQEFARAIALQLRLTGFSSELQQLRTQYAEYSDKINNFQEKRSGDLSTLTTALENKREKIQIKINELSNEFNEILQEGGNLENSVVQVAGNDAMFDLADSKKKDELKLFGDKLFHATMRRREDVVYNIDRNLFIVSDEYDKDYDIQSFVLKMRQQSPEMFKGSWMSVYQLCNNIAETLDFELFCDTQGHIVFRPPQYNRIPATIFESMLRLNQMKGIKLFPEFLEKLYVSRESNIIRDIVALEWEISMKGALLGFKISKYDDGSYKMGVVRLLSKQIGETPFFLSDVVLDKQSSIKIDEALTMDDRKKIKEIVKASNQSIQSNSGLFSALSQFTLQRESIGFYDLKNKNSAELSDEESYNLARKQIAKFNGTPPSEYEEFDKAKVGAKRNGQKTPSSDISKIISEISELISQRSTLLRTLDRVTSQVVEIGSIWKDGSFNVESTNIINTNKLTNIMSRLIEDDSKDIIGHLSGSRFIIKDEHIFNSNFIESPPENTIVTVRGGETILGQQDEASYIGTQYVAFGADFDMWRQYGWRSERTYDKPFFINAELQCAPYATMLLSRQRKNVVKGTIRVIGNEFYQLGDVVYVANRQLLYYVNKVSHTFDYNGTFTTTLDLTYGHPPGEYITTPLDIIGKMASRQGRAQNAFRVRRQLPNANVLLGIVQFESTEDNRFDFLIGKYGEKNYDELIKSIYVASESIIKGNSNTSPRIYIMTYAGNEDVQKLRRGLIQDWLHNPEKPTSAKNDIGKSGQGGDSSENGNPNNSKIDITRYSIPYNIIVDKHLRICIPDAKFTATEEEIIKVHQIVASQEAISIDNTLESIVELRLVQPPEGGW